MIDHEAVTLPVKAVPGARCDEIVGWLGERLKVRVSAPPEDGRANKAICLLIAQRLGIKTSAVKVARGLSSAEKTLLLTGVTEAQVLACWPRRGS